MKTSKILFILVLIFGMYSCDKEDTVIDTEDVQLKLSVKLSKEKTPTTYAAKSYFEPRDELGLFATNAMTDELFVNLRFPFNIKASFLNYDWSLDSPVFLTSIPLKLFAYYPYNPYSATLPVENQVPQIPIEHESQTDYLYGKALENGGISKYSPTVSLEMCHALAMLQFKFVDTGDPHLAYLKHILVSGSNPNAFFSHGTMNIITGDITKTAGKYDSAVISDHQIQYPLIPNHNAGEDNYPKLLVMPLETTTRDGEIYFQFIIDDEKYDWNLPAGTSWESGKKYTYEVELHYRNLHIRTVKIKDWVEGKPGSVILQ